MNVVEIPISGLLLSLSFILVACGVSAALGLGLIGALLRGAARAATQLWCIGYALVFVFGHERAWMVLSLITFMLLIAALTSAGRIETSVRTRGLWLYALLAVGGGASVALIPAFWAIMVPHPWFEARTLVPISGMMLSSAMNVVAQVLERMFAMAKSERALIEQLLALGASPEQALSRATRAAMRAALIPAINGLATVGLVALPGMMTGQILSGAAPDHAVRYQLVIMYQIVAVAAVSGALATLFARRIVFNSEEQLRTL